MNWLRRKLAPFERNGLDALDRQSLLRWKDRYRGRRVFIIGNGPSLSTTDLRPLKDEVTIASNGIFLMFERMGFLPTFYTVEDVLVAEDRAAVINGIRGTTKIFPEDLKHCLKRDPDTLYINFCRPGYLGFPKFSDRFEERVYWGGTVTFLNLQLAYYLGSREMYLVGVDHHYHQHTEDDSKAGSVITSGSMDRNHFHPDYFGPGFRYHDPRVDRMEAAYRKAKEFLAQRGCAVFNATLGGRLEVFPRVSFAEISR